LGAPTQNLIRDHDDLEMKHMENLLTDFEGCDYFFKKIIVGNPKTPFPPNPL
jgi:hypothetical protein